jgi:hypothetical protein
MRHAALRVPIGDAAAYLEETEQLDVRGVRVLLRHVRQQRLLGSGGRELRELQADTALRRWMRCSCCAQYVPQQPRPIQCERAGDETLRSTASSAKAIPTRASARARCARASA